MNLNYGQPNKSKNVTCCGILKLELVFTEHLTPPISISAKMGYINMNLNYGQPNKPKNVTYCGMLKLELMFTDYLTPPISFSAKMTMTDQVEKKQCGNVGTLLGAKTIARS